MNEHVPAIAGDALDWLHDQGQRRSAAVPEFDVEKTLRKMRSAGRLRAVDPEQVGVQAVRCSAESSCIRTSSLRVEVHDPPGTIVGGKVVNTCVDHLGHVVRELSQWAAMAELTDGCIQVCVIETETIPVGHGSRVVPAVRTMRC